MAKGYVPIFFDWLETTQDLSAEEKGNLIDAVVSYAAGLDYEHLLCGSCKIAFRFLKGQVDRNAAIADVRRQAREGKKQAVTNDNKTQQNVSNGNTEEQEQSSFPNNNNNNNNNKNKDNKERVSGKPQKRFTPPTLEEVEIYCIERRNHVNAGKWYDYYSANGWRVGKNPMKDWKAAVRTWERSAWTEEEYRQERELSDLPY